MIVSFALSESYFSCGMLQWEIFVFYDFKNLEKEAEDSSLDKSPADNHI